MTRAGLLWAIPALLAAACAPTLGESNATLVRHGDGAPASSIRGCSGHVTAVPDRAFNFDLFVATQDDLQPVFPGSLPPRSVPHATRVFELRDPFTGRLVAGPFDPPFTALSFQPDGPWAETATIVDLQVAVARKLPWIECAGLPEDGFETLGDVLGVPRPAQDDAQRAFGVVPERLVVVLYPPPDTAHGVKMFPSDFQKALVEVHDTASLGTQWSNAFRASRIPASESAKVEGFEGREGPPPDAELLRPYFTGLASDIVSLARIGLSTRRNLYLHTWPD
jgi:hypothetical protein